MLISISLICLVGMFMAFLCKKIRLPGLVGMIATGIVLGPYALNLISSEVLNISGELRRIALIIILMRAGLSLDVSGLKKVGRSAVLMCFLPAAFEILGYVVLAPKLLNVSLLEAALMGSVLAAVSPAVIVPRMIKISEEKWGTEKQIPQMILAGASVDDVFVIVMFSAFLGMCQGQDISWIQFAKVPVSILLGSLFGFVLGLGFGKYFEKFHMRDSVKVIILLAVAFALDWVEGRFGATIPFSGLIAVMALGIGLQKKREAVAGRLSIKFNKLWVCAEVILFVLVGSCVDINYTCQAGFAAVALIGLVLIFRILGVVLCVSGTNLNFKERLFCAFGYIPKATVQAAIGGVPLAMGLAAGNVILSVAVLGILITAPVGAFLIDLSYQNLLTKQEETR